MNKADKTKKAMLSKHDSDFTAIVHINALLGSMDALIAFNGVYSNMFGTSPPARACVAVNLPSPHQVALECLAFADASPLERFALHVQGISYWAPANIGPYSQAVGVRDLVQLRHLY
jgi:diphthine-ammonia ligase